MSEIFELIRTFDIADVVVELDEEQDRYYFRVELLKQLGEPIFRFRVLSRLHYRIRPSFSGLPPDHVPDELIDVEDCHLTSLLEDLTQGNEDELCRQAAKRILDFFGQSS